MFAVAFAILAAFRKEELSDNYLRSGVISSYLRHVEMLLFIRQIVRRQHCFFAWYFLNFLLETSNVINTSSWFAVHSHSIMVPSSMFSSSQWFDRFADVTSGGLLLQAGN